MDFWDQALRLLNITVIDIALSGDNAIVIGMAAATLPKEKRPLAIGVGGGLAIVLRVALTAGATLLMLIPGLSAAGGLILIWVIYKLLKPQDEDKSEGKRAGSFREAIFLIVAADFMMSLDNVLAVAGSAHGSIFLLVAGLAISMPLLMVAGGFISSFIDKARWLVYLGAAAIAFTAARMVFEDKFVAARLGAGAGALVENLAAAVAAALVPAAIALFFRLRSRRDRKPEKP
jgi:YjbE family integral membrane protein